MTTTIDKALKLREQAKDANQHTISPRVRFANIRTSEPVKSGEKKAAPLRK